MDDMDDEIRRAIKMSLMEENRAEGNDRGEELPEIIPELEMDEETRRVLALSSRDNINGHAAVPQGGDRVDGPATVQRDPAMMATAAAAGVSYEDEQIQAALEASRREMNGGRVENEDEQLQAALLASTMGGTAAVDGDSDLQKALLASMQTGGNAGLSQSTSEIEIQRAIEASIMSSGTAATAANFSDPSRMIRDEAVPIGLRNVGNTCYVNSLLQTYFMIPPFRHYILSSGYYEVEEEEAVTFRQSKKFMNELQTLFASMLYSNKKIADPSFLLHSIVDEKGNNMEIGKQEDVGEFMDLFHDWMEKCVQRLQTRDDETNMIQEMFLIEGVSTMVAEELDGEKVTMNLDEKFSFLMLDVQESNFHNSLESRLSTEMDWTTPKGHNTVARQETWLKKLPPILMFREQRIEYVPNVGAVKNNSALLFEKNIDMERYLIQNKEIAEGKRIISSNLRSQLLDVQTQLDSFSDYKGLGTSLETILDGASLFLEEDDPELFLAFKNVKEKKMAQIIQLQEEAEGLKSQIQEEYFDLTGSPYTLVGLWLHSGHSAGSGHYWAYIRDPSVDTWCKYNDTEVTPVKEEKVWEDAVGGIGTGVSAYFLIYVSTDILSDYSDVQYNEIIAPEILDIVQRQNINFDREKEEYAAVHVDSPVEVFTKKLNTKIIETERRSNDSAYARDFRYFDAATFLYSFGRVVESKTVMYMETYDELYANKNSVPSVREIQESILNSSNINMKISRDELTTILDKVQTFSSEPDIKKRFYDECEKYSYMMHQYYLGITNTIKQDFEIAIKHLHQAMVLKNELREGTARLDISTVLFTICKHVYTESLLTKDLRLLQILPLVIPILMALSDEEEKQNTRNNFVNWFIILEDQKITTVLQPALDFIVEERENYFLPGRNHFPSLEKSTSYRNEDCHQRAKNFFLNYSLLMTSHRSDIIKNQKYPIFEAIYEEINSIDEEKGFIPFKLDIEKKKDPIKPTQ